MYSRKIAQFLFVIFFIFFGVSFGNAITFDEWLGHNPVNVNLLEFKQLPGYCQCKMYYHHQRGQEAKKSRKNQEWQIAFGSDYAHLHHYCWGLVYLSRARSAQLKDSERKFLVQKAIGNFDYVIKQAASRSPFLWMYHQKKGEALLLVHKNAEAQMEFKKAKLYKKNK